MELTAKQERLAAECLIDLNATQAAIRSVYSEKTASETGYENLRKPRIADAGFATLPMPFMNAGYGGPITSPLFWPMP